jgi:hypothetical protein
MNLLFGVKGSYKKTTVKEKLILTNPTVKPRKNQINRNQLTIAEPLIFGKLRKKA